MARRKGERQTPSPREHAYAVGWHEPRNCYRLLEFYFSRRGSLVDYAVESYHRYNTLVGIHGMGEARSEGFCGKLVDGGGRTAPIPRCQDTIETGHARAAMNRSQDVRLGTRCQKTTRCAQPSAPDNEKRVVSDLLPNRMNRNVASFEWYSELTQVGF